MNLHTGLAQLKAQGMTRELPVFGWILDERGGGSCNDSFAVGIIDELWLTPAPDGGGGGSVRIVDHKTRVQATLPTAAQTRTTHMQLMAYKKLYDGVVTMGLDPLRRQGGAAEPGERVKTEPEAARRVEVPGAGEVRKPWEGREQEPYDGEGADCSGKRLVCLRLGLNPDQQLSDPIVAHAVALGLLEERGGDARLTLDLGAGSGDKDGGGGSGVGADARPGENVSKSGIDSGGGGGTQISGGGNVQKSDDRDSQSGDGGGGMLRPLTLGDVFDAVSRAAMLLPPSSDTLYVEYEWQRNGSVIGQDSFAHDAHWLERRVERHLAFWNGTRRDEEEEDGENDGAAAAAAEGGDAHMKNGVFGVSDNEAWKCLRCRFSGDCPTAAVFAERWRATHQPPQI